MKSATRILAAAMGTIMGLGGVEHGIGEILQGPVAPERVMILSWPDSAFFSIVAGEPAMTILPDLRIAGILTVFVSLIFTVWSIFFIHRKHGGLVLIGLSIAMLLVGGGLGPPVIGVIIGAAAMRINAAPRQSGGSAHGLRQFIRKVWPVIFTACIAAWLLMFPGLSILDYSFGRNYVEIIPGLAILAFGLLLAAIFTGYVRDGAY